MIHRTEAQSEIRELIEKWALAIAERDLDGISADHASDILMFDVAILETRGAASYRESWRAMFPWLGNTGRSDLSQLEVKAGDDAADAPASVGCSGTDLQRRDAELTVRLLIGLVRLDGRGTVTHEHQSEVSAGRSVD